MSQAQRQENGDLSGRPQSPYLNRPSPRGGNVSPSSPLSTTLIPRDYLGQRSDPPPPPPSSTSRSGAGAVNPRKPNPSPLHSSYSPQSPPARDFDAEDMTVKTQTASRVQASHPYSSRSFYDGATAENDSADSKKETAQDVKNKSAQQSSYNTLRGVDVRGQNQSLGHSDGSSTAVKPPTHSQLRNLSSSSTSVQGSPPTSPTSVTPTVTTDRKTSRNMPRNSSMDSTVSAVSSTASHSHKSSMDITGPTADDIAKLIATAGSPEAVIQQLLVEKQHTASREAQLWRLLEKQKMLLSGLNKDLDRALKDKEVFKVQLQDQLQKIPSLSKSAPQPTFPALREESESTKDHAKTGTLARQVAQDRDLKPNGNVVDATRTPERKPPMPIGSSPLDPAMVPSPLHLLQQQTQSSATTNKMANFASKESTEGHDSTGEITPKPQRVERTVQSKAPVLELPVGVEDPSQRNAPATLASLPPLQSSMAPPSLALIEPSPMNERPESKAFRKAPPAPLNLNQLKRASTHLHQAGPADEHSESEYDDILEVDEIPTFERGRRKTREDDDREREAAIMREQEARSRSKKQKLTKSPTPEKPKESQAPLTGLPSSPRQIIPHSPPASMSDHLSAPSSIAAVLSPPTSETSSLREQWVSSPPMSPGLPASPRPGDRPLGSPLPRMPREGPMNIASPPLSPRYGVVGLPLSPRAPKHPIPLPPNTPLSLASPLPTKTEMPAQLESRPSDNLKPPGDGQSMRSGLAPSIPSVGPPPQIFRGFMSDQYPGLLLPPNALPSIEVKTSSSRLRPSRNSYMALKATDEEPVFTLSIFSRSDRAELWRLEKVTLSLPHLDHQIKQVSNFSAKIPDRQLFAGHSPAKIDARRAALDYYFDALLNTPMDENAALVLCQFLSSDAIEPRDDETSLLKGANSAKPVLSPGPDGRPRKEGYLTKRGKNFGGWKARFFVLQGPELKYYDSPSGPHLGNIKLQNAQIGKQSPNTNQSPSRSEDDSENQYRHAFLILEPKRHNATKLIRHVLCAESDGERDSWVEALLKYVDYPSSDDESSKGSKSRRDGPSHITGLNAKIRLYASDSPSVKEAESPDSDKSEALRVVPYEATVPAEAPRRGPPPGYRTDETPSPPAVTVLAPPTQPPPMPPSQSTMSISGPTNGVKIEDAGAWGNKPTAPVKETSKEHKKRSIWGFRQRSSSDLIMQLPNESNSSLPQGNAPERSAYRKGSVRAAFGMPLAEAVECCPPDGVDVNVHLPAVVYRCIEYLDAKGAASEEGIFRLSGSNVVVKALKERFNTEGDVDFLADDHYYDVHAVASLLKLYLRELPTTVLTRELHLDFLHVLELDDKKKKVPAFNFLVHKLPKANWSILRALSQFLITIVNNSDRNKMTVRNVGIVFSPTLNIPAPVFAMFLTEFDGIFGPATAPPPPTAPATKVTEINVEKPLTPDDIRSPRHQMFSDIPTPAYNQSTFPNVDRRLDMPSSQAAYDTGFIPLQPSYEPQIYGTMPYDQRNGGHPAPPNGEPQYGSMNRMLAPSNASSVKAKRRESSMLFMGMGNRKSSVPKLREDQSMVEDDSAFD